LGSKFPLTPALSPEERAGVRGNGTLGTHQVLRNRSVLVQRARPEHFRTGDEAVPAPGFAAS